MATQNSWLMKLYNVIIRVGRLLHDLTIKLGLFLDDDVAIRSSKYSIFTIFILITQLAPLFLDLYFPNAIYINIIASALALVIYFVDYLPKSARKFFPFYWYFALWFCLAFIPGYNIVAYAVNKKSMLLFSSSASLLLLLLLINWLTFLLISTSGLIMGALGYFWSYRDTPAFPIDEAESIYLILWLYIIVFISSVFIRINSNDKTRREQLHHKNLFGSTVAHEILSPLATIKDSYNSIL